MSHTETKTALWKYHTDRKKRKRLERIREARRAELEYRSYRKERDLKFIRNQLH